MCIGIAQTQSGRHSNHSKQCEVQSDYPLFQVVQFISICFRLQIALVTGQTLVWPWFTITSMEAETLDLIVVLRSVLITFG